MLNDYINLPQVQFMIEHYKGLIVMFIVLSLILYFSMMKKNDNVKITDHSIKSSDKIINVTKKYNKITYLVEGLSVKPREFETLEDAEKYYSKFELLEATTWGDAGNNIKRYVIGNRIS